MITRRIFLGQSGALLAGCASLPGDGYGGFRMGMESWCVRKFDLDRVLASYRELGLTYAEIYPPPIMPDPDKAAFYREKLDKAGLLAWAVWADFTKDDAKNRKAFEFAKALGGQAIPCGITPDAFESVEKLTREFGLPIAIHNGGPKDKYGKIAALVEALEKRPVAMGVCVDTGNFIRAGEDPIQAIRTLGSRTHVVHLKDSDGVIMSTVMGKGKLDLVGTLRAIRDVGFKGLLCLEYEQNPDNPMDDLRECLARVREAISKM